jgi:signal peptidase I
MASKPLENAASSPAPRPSWLRVGWEWTKSIAIAVGIAMLIRWPIAEPFKIPSGSMIPTLQINDRIFVNKHAYGIRWPFNGFRIPFTRTTVWYTDKWLWKGPLPQRWDVVVFKSVEEGVEHDTLVKRVVGLPGERVLIRGGKIYVNGEALTLPPEMPQDTYYTDDPYHQSSGYALIPDDAHSLVPEDCVLLFGDNSAQSRDARWFGFMPHKNLLGRVTAIWWPMSHWRDFSGFTHRWWWRGGWTLLALYVLFRVFVGRTVKVYSDGLSGAVGRGEHLLIRFSLGVPIPFTGQRIGPGREPRRGDVVLYRPPKDANAPELLLGIVAGLPEEKVYVDDGRLHIDNRPLSIGGILSEPRFAPNAQGGKFGMNKNKEFSAVPAGHYFLLSNGSGTAPDSRSLGWISRDRLVGTATRVWWPLSAARRLLSK